MKSNPVKKKLRRPAVVRYVALVGRFVRRASAGSVGFRLAHARYGTFSRSIGRRPPQIFGAIADAGCVPLARVPEGNHFLHQARARRRSVGHRRADGQHRRASPARSSPRRNIRPQGNRSLGGGLHGLNFAATAGEYFKRANDEILVVLQTESPEGVRNAEAIYSLPGVDAIFVGPVDLRANMRSPMAPKPATPNSKPRSPESSPPAKKPAPRPACT